MPGSVIVAGARTPIGKLSGALKDFKAVELGGLSIKAALERAGITGEQVDYVIMGHVLQAGTGQITARQAAVRGGIPMTVPALTVNKVCLSGLDAIALADQLITCGEFDVVVAGGMESMTSAPHLLSGARAGYRLGGGELVDSMMYDGLFCSFDELGMGAAAETYTKLKNVSREEQDAFSAASHGRAAAAMKNGSFDAEIVPVSVPQRRGDPLMVTEDEGVRPETTAEALAKLKAVFRAGGSVTAGNASQMSDGAAAVLLASEKAIKDYGLTPLARFVGFAVAGVPPEIMGIGPKAAIPKVCKQTGIKQDDLDWIELNEAFAAQALAVIKDIGLNPDKINPLGGAIALGHPLGATGAVRIATLLSGLRRRKQKYGMVTMCIGTGMGAAGIFEVV